MTAAQEAVWQDAHTTAPAGKEADLVDTAGPSHQSTLDDAAAYFASVHSAQDELDAEGLSLMVSEIGAVAPLPGMEQNAGAAAAVPAAETAGTEGLFTAAAAGAGTRGAAAAASEGPQDEKVSSGSADVGAVTGSTKETLAFPAGSGAAAAKLVQEARSIASSNVEDNQAELGRNDTVAAAPLPSPAASGIAPPEAADGSSTAQLAGYGISISTLQAAGLEAVADSTRGAHEEVVSPEDVIITGSVGEDVEEDAGAGPCASVRSAPIDLLELD